MYMTCIYMFRYIDIVLQYSHSYEYVPLCVGGGASVAATAAVVAELRRRPGKK